MRFFSGKKGGVAIIVVAGLTLTLTLAVLYLYVLVSSRVDALHSYNDRFLAYYLCETGISVAMLDFGKGKIGRGAGQWTEREFDFDVGGKTYKIHYKLAKVAGSANYKIISSVESPSGLNKTFYLSAAGPRAFPIFIRGFAGGGGK